VIGLPDHGRKVSIRDDRMLPRMAIVDPALTDHCPRGVTLASGLDALAQVIEPYVSARPRLYRCAGAAGDRAGADRAAPADAGRGCGRPR
jgi:alcohol dehydrogenase class IV